MFLRSNRIAAAVAVVGISFLVSCSTIYGQTWRVTVKGGETDPAETPIVSVLEDDLPTGVYILAPVVGTVMIEAPAQVFEESGKRFLAFILPRARRSPSYLLKKQPTNASEPQALRVEHNRGISFRAEGPNLAISINQKPLTVYHVDVGNKPFFFPLIGQSGDSVTRAFPMQVLDGEKHDHPHQRSCWFTFGKVNGVDFWGEAKNSGTIRESARTIVVEGPTLGRLATTNDWRKPDGKRVCQDQRITTFYCTHDARLIDFEIKVTATDGPVTFGDTKEGMFGLRVASSMDVDKTNGGKITNAEGLTDQKAWGQASPWVDYVGPVKEKTVGIAIFNHPDSFRYPTTWHVRTYGLFAANPFGWHDFGSPEKGDYTVPAGQSITFRYRVILHEGDTGSAGLSQRFRSYAQPPALEIKKQ
jgi:hypothetical protein